MSHGGSTQQTGPVTAAYKRRTVNMNEQTQRSTPQRTFQFNYYARTPWTCPASTHNGLRQPSARSMKHMGHQQIIFQFIGSLTLRDSSFLADHWNSTVIFDWLVRVGASGDTGLSRTIFRAVLEQFQIAH